MSIREDSGVTIKHHPNPGQGPGVQPPPTPSAALGGDGDDAQAPEMKPREAMLPGEGWAGTLEMW